jgi:hypothetical protein
MAEWFKATDLRSVGRKVLVGSNPARVNNNNNIFLFLFLFFLKDIK